ncbi:MerR family transcriptional regulator [Virgibacillus ndiopensis]|uniref:MerR family transcriptional regulator n=1 Tax=Virgibacillus ndiopensis TaxID=2004408 RepID=UPI00159BBBCE|nr:methyltransferase domain-containing protein [Virgibacillus ndiopensis]
MHIKEVAKRLNTTARSIRFYEEKGLISPIKDAENDYRTFTDNDMMRLSTILALREIGISVENIREILEDPEMNIKQYLTIQRSALFEKWIEIKDMIETIDKMVDRTGNQENCIGDIQELSQHLKTMKNIRKSWKDKWNFDKQAADYDQNIKMHGYRFNVHQDYEQALEKVVTTISLAPGDMCLDIGIGTGNLGSRFLDSGVNVIGVDQSEEMLKQCKEKHPSIETRKGHFLTLPLMDIQVDGVVSSYALHHIPDTEKLLALQEMSRVVKDEGQICIVDLMFLDTNHQMQVLERFRSEGNLEAIDAIEDEYYADRSLLINWFNEHNFYVETHQFNDILSMIYATKR